MYDFSDIIPPKFFEFCDFLEFCRRQIFKYKDVNKGLPLHSILSHLEAEGGRIKSLLLDLKIALSDFRDGGVSDFEWSHELAENPKNKIPLDKLNTQDITQIILFFKNVNKEIIKFFYERYEFRIKKIEILAEDFINKASALEFFLHNYTELSDTIKDLFEYQDLYPNLIKADFNDPEIDHIGSEAGSIGRDQTRLLIPVKDGKGRQKHSDISISDLKSIASGGK